MTGVQTCALPICRSGAQEQEPLVGKLLSGQAQRSEDADQDNAGGALYIVIEGADLVAIAREDGHRVEVGEILPLDAAFRVELLHGGDELVDESEIFFSADAVLAQPLIERIVEQALIVRANIENNGQAVWRREARA